MTLFQMIEQVIGKPPVGWEFITYLVAIILFFFVVKFVLGVLQIAFKTIGGRIL